MLTVYGLYGKFLRLGFVGTEHKLWSLQHAFVKTLEGHSATDTATPAMLRLFFKLENCLDRRPHMLIDVP